MSTRQQPTLPDNGHTCPQDTRPPTPTTTNTLGVELILPVDVVIADAFDNDAKIDVVPVENIPDGYMALDHGPKTCALLRYAP
eukprot:1350604-Amorphochlora_amoeboformis.AAC.1